MKKALIVGINHYSSLPLQGCINDAKEIEKLLGKNEDNSPNFDCKTLLSKESSAGSSDISSSDLENGIRDLFSTESEIALFYFSGHGDCDQEGVSYLTAQDGSRFDMSRITTFIEKSKAKECVILLDCCFSDGVGDVPQFKITHLREGVSILAACKNNQLASERGGAGLFTSLVCDALRGSASDLLGRITATSIYAHVEPIFNAWEQRPLFKTHVSKSTTLRKCNPHIDLQILRDLSKLFPTFNSNYKLDKSYEPTESRPNPNHKIFSDLQKCRANGLIKLDKEDHMYYEAMNNGTCSLTPLGQFYWHLAWAGRI